jgi:Ca2+-binding EF-hand superfamily protein
MDTFFKLVKSFRNKNPGELHDSARLAASKFDEGEIALLQMTWKDLADRTNGKGIDKDTFLQYFPLNGLLGERLFVQFDTKKTGYIDFDEFIIGLSTVCRGTPDDKIHFVFNMYDVSRNSTVSKQELTTLLNQIPKNLLRNYYQDDHDASGYHSTSSEDGADERSTSSRREDDLDEVDQYTNHELVERAFEQCDLNHLGTLSYEEFKMWVERNPAVMDYIESILPYHGPRDSTPLHDKNEILPRILSTRLSRGD